MLPPMDCRRLNADWSAAARMESPVRTNVEITSRVSSRISVFPLFLVV